MKAVLGIAAYALILAYFYGAYQLATVLKLGISFGLGLIVWAGLWPVPLALGVFVLSSWRRRRAERNRLLAVANEIAGAETAKDVRERLDRAISKGLL